MLDERGQTNCDHGEWTCDERTAGTAMPVALGAPKATAIDLFAGAGGVTTGLKAANVSVLAAVELDPTAAASYQANHEEVDLICDDIIEVCPNDLMQRLNLSPGELTLLAACAPCQGFSSLGPNKPNDMRNDLVLRVLDFVRVLRPAAVAFENVPQLARDWRFFAFVEGLRSIGYGVQPQIINAADFHVPQRRRRLVALAVDGVKDEQVPRLKAHPPDCACDSKDLPTTVREALAQLRPLDSDDLLHVSRQYPAHVLQRIRAIPKDGGSRKDLPPELRLRCHEHLGTSSGSVYGRMRWDDVAPTLTTRCTSPSCGRFLHPEEDRAITLREASVLQTFPVGYKFRGGRMAIEAQIGNAVPVELVKAIWDHLTPAVMNLHSA